MVNILYIHGANSTKLTWNYITANLPAHTSSHFEYSTQDGVDHAVARVADLLNNQGEKWSIVAHSLGGVIAVCAALKTKKIDKIISISTPYGGSATASMAKFFHPRNQLFHDIDSYGPLAQKLSKKTFKCPVPVKAITTFRNAPSFMTEANDGVVTLASQRALVHAEYETLELNHFEVLLSGQTIEFVRSYIWP